MARDLGITEAFYAATDQIVDRGLRRDDSLFAPGRSIWTAQVAAEVAAAIAPEDISPGTFEEKLAKQLEGLSPDGVQFAAEILYVALLPEHDTGAARKRQLVEIVLALLPAPPSIPPDLDTALGSGIATYGQGGRNMRDASLRYLATSVLAWKQLDGPEQQRLSDDPWLFRDFARSIEMRRGDMQREALLYFVFPDSFEPIVSTGAKTKIATTFSNLAEDASAPIDERILSIRRAMEEEYGAGFSFYGDVLPDIWRTPSGAGGHAWLIRGATDHGINRIADWLERGYVSIGWEDSLGVHPGMSIPELARAIRDARSDFNDAKVRMGAGNMDRFFERMAIGDVVATVDGDDVYLGRITGDPAKRGSGEAGAVWQRDVAWLNATEPFARPDLAADLQTALKTRMTLTDLSKHHSALDGLLGETEQWDAFLHWAGRIYETPGFDAEERDYKLEVADRLKAARQAVEAGEADWVSQLRRAFGGNNNLTSWRAHNTFIEWCELNPEAGAAYLPTLWKGEPDDDQLSAMFDEWPIGESPGDRVAIVSFLLGAVDPHRLPVYRAQPVGRARKLLGLAPIEGNTTEDLVRRYRMFLELLDELSQRLAQRGTEIRDRVDAQSLVWWLTSNPPPESWDEDEKRVFLDWRGESKSNNAQGMAAIPSVGEALADSLFVTRPWLAEIVELLNEKRQVVFYGPPGTGKTFIAQALAHHVEETGGVSELVQFHPAYSYEDFFEGYRPKLDGASGVEYELRAGPLRRIADAARENLERPHLLIIDEINRGNIAKIFGELYFLLEYRERGIKLQYSPEVNFSLPENLYVIGTMNTADRSIALVDSALRRRFYFVPFLPSEPPLRGVLRRWLSHEGYGLEAADYLERLNEVLAQSGGDDEFAIGHSYFITRNGAPDIARVWRHALAPLLEERFYGARAPADIERTFSPEAIHETPGEPEL